MASWSAYDGRLETGKPDDGLRMFKGIEMLRQKLNPTQYMKGREIVFIGEFGVPENIDGHTRENVRPNGMR